MKDTTTMMKADAAMAKPASPDRLDKLRDKVRELRELEITNASLSDQVTQNNKKINNMRFTELVDLFDAAKVTKIGVPAEGNLPPYELEVKPFYKANIGELPDADQAKAFAWLEKNKHGDMIKSTYTVTFGMGDTAKRKAFEAILKKGKYDFDYKFGVPWNTLTAFVKEQIEERKKEPPLKLLGATVGRFASLVKAKKEARVSTKGKK